MKAIPGGDDLYVFYMCGMADKSTDHKCWTTPLKEHSVCSNGWTTYVCSKHEYIHTTHIQMMYMYNTLLPHTCTKGIGLTSSSSPAQLLTTLGK